MRTLGVGMQEYDEIVQKKMFYVDKTAFIREWWEGGKQVTLVTRPRRFGKTMLLHMVDCFFSAAYAGREDLFLGKRIWEQEEYRRLQGTYPVIFLSFANIKPTDAEHMKRGITKQIVRLYDAHDYLLCGDFLKKNEREQFLSVRMGMEEGDLLEALHDLSCYLSRYYGKKVIILLDEYDTPMQEAYLGGYWDGAVQFMKGFFNSTFKTNPYLERALLTGITRVSKESIFSDFNNPDIVTATTPRYEASFGFTEEEVFAALEEYGLSGQKEMVKFWYDGFNFGRVRDIYNPWSISKFLDERQFGTYWTNTSSNELVSRLIREGGANLKMEMEDLLNGKAISTNIDEQVVFSRLEGNKEAVWNLLVASGYLKIVSEQRGAYQEVLFYRLQLTNFEVQLMFETLIGGWFQNGTEQYHDFVRALLAGDLEEMNAYMNRVALETFSYFDAGKGPSGRAEPERFYHGFVLGLMVDLKERYSIRSNRESGFGRYDVMLCPKEEGLDAVILEFKVHNPKKEKDLAETAAAALAQIEEKRYEADLLAEGVMKERIRKYGFAFRGKEVLIA